MNTVFRDRFLLPIGIVLGAFVLVEILVFSLSRVLLAVSHTEAVFVALGVALAILFGSALVASRPRIRSSTLAALCVLAFLAVVGAGILNLQRAEDTAGHGPETGSVEAPPGH